MLEVFFITLNLQSGTYPVNVTPYGFTLHFHYTPYFFPRVTHALQATKVQFLHRELRICLFQA